ncbi:MAG TPA: metalloenzyme [Roseiflexaceae bacterium]|nr:metalloenzyme [Roseiflexaceae bacterium]
MAVIFFFLDGVGLAPGGPDNPLAAVPTPTLCALLGGPLTSERVQQQSDLLLKPIDATMGVAGLPQSGTGHTALLAGVNAAVLHGRHQPAYPPVALRPLLAERSLLRRVTERGGRATFANVFVPEYWQAISERRARRPASVIAAEGAGLRFRDLDDLRAGAGLSWDITGSALRQRFGESVPEVSAWQAGVNLARLADNHDLVFFECFLPDLAAHGRMEGGLDAALELVDACLGGALAALGPATTLVLTSDHGNAESLAAPAHTRNPVPLLAVGPQALAFAAVEDITGVAGVILEALGLDDGHTSPEPRGP